MAVGTNVAGRVREVPPSEVVLPDVCFDQGGRGDGKFRKVELISWGSLLTKFSGPPVHQIENIIDRVRARRDQSRRW